MTQTHCNNTHTAAADAAEVDDEEDDDSGKRVSSDADKPRCNCLGLCVKEKKVKDEW